MYNIVFVILHYETIDDTRKCINSIIKYLSYDNVQIIVVDNGSKKGRLKSLEPLYLSISKIHFLYSKENLGFAKGNNIGYTYAKKSLNAEIIILANNDLIFEQEDFIQCLEDKYKSTKFDVAGPRIISLIDGKNQNPVSVHYQSINDVNKRIIKCSVLFILSILNIDLIMQKKVSKGIDEYIPLEDSDYQLHGACIFFGNRYLEKYDGLYDKTFMYGEEGILKYIVKRDGMKMLYIDDTVVLHKEGSSTDSIHGKGKKKRQFYYKWNIDSCILLKNIMKEK